MSRWVAPMLLLAGCWGGRVMDDDVWWETGAWWETGDRWETGEAPDTDVPLTGGVAITYTFAGVAGCEEAGLDSVALRVIGYGDDVAYLCNDEPLRLFELEQKTWQVIVIGETVDGLLWRSEPTHVTIDGGSVIDVAVEIACVDDGSGGCPTGGTE